MNEPDPANYVKKVVCVPVVAPVLRPDDVNFIVAEVARLLQHTLLTGRVHPAQISCKGTVARDFCQTLNLRISP